VDVAGMAWGANAPQQGGAGTQTRPSGTTGTLPVGHAAGTQTTTSAGGAAVTINVNAVPTQPSDPAMADLVRAIDLYLKRTGHPAGLGVG
jgi:hypothetical protein